MSISNTSREGGKYEVSEKSWPKISEVSMLSSIAGPLDSLPSSASRKPCVHQSDGSVSVDAMEWEHEEAFLQLHLHGEFIFIFFGSSFIL